MYLAFSVERKGAALRLAMGPSGTALFFSEQMHDGVLEEELCLRDEAAAREFVRAGNAVFVPVHSQNENKFSAGQMEVTFTLNSSGWPLIIVDPGDRRGVVVTLRRQELKALLKAVLDFWTDASTKKSAWTL